jgi:hypothetical protein
VPDQSSGTATYLDGVSRPADSGFTFEELDQQGPRSNSQTGNDTRGGILLDFQISFDDFPTGLMPQGAVNLSHLVAELSRGVQAEVDRGLSRRRRCDIAGAQERDHAHAGENRFVLHTRSSRPDRSLRPGMFGL